MEMENDVVNNTVRMTTDQKAMICQIWEHALKSAISKSHA